MRAAAQRDPFDTIREHAALRGILRRELRTAGQRTLAPEIGIGRGALRKFLAMSTPGHDTIDRLREWSEGRPAVDVAPGSVALAVLAGDFPAPWRAWARRQIARRVAELLSKVGAGTPSWLAEESSGQPFHP